MSSKNISLQRWEVIDDNLIDDIKSIKDSSICINKQINKIEDKLNKIDQIVDNLTTKYQELEASNQVIIDFLKENRSLYIEALNNVEQNETKNYNEIKPYIKNYNTTPLLDNLNYNRFLNFSWRNSRLTTTPNIIPNIITTKNIDTKEEENIEENIGESIE